jgi:hypothetical protein
MIEPDALEHSRAVGAARKVMQCRTLAQTIKEQSPEAGAALEVLRRAEADFAQTVRDYADAAIAGTFYSPQP